jgi:hypothetical protein
MFDLISVSILWRSNVWSVCSGVSLLERMPNILSSSIKTDAITSFFSTCEIVIFAVSIYRQIISIEICRMCANARKASRRASMESLRWLLHVLQRNVSVWAFQSSKIEIVSTTQSGQGATCLYVIALNQERTWRIILDTWTGKRSK